MKIGVVCDTHNNQKNVRRIIELFNEAGVERVVHTGDVTKASTLDLFAELNCPLFGVYGNNDLERESLDECVRRHKFIVQDPPLRLRWHGKEILVVHDPLDLDAFDLNSIDLTLHGHTHLHRVEKTPNGLIFNPGECAGHMIGKNAIGVVDLQTLEASLLYF